MPRPFFSLIYKDNDIWGVKNSRGEWWCGDDHEWVFPGSSYWETDPDCWEEEFTFEELKPFIQEMFGTKI